MADTKNNITVEQKLRAIYDLQLIDSRLDEIKNTRGELPLEVEDLEDDLVLMNKRIEKIKDEILETENNVKLRKEAIKNAEALIKKYGKQQDKVRNNREYEALSKEIEYQELEIELAEKHINQFRASITNKEELLAEQNEKLVGLQEHLKHKKAELAGIIKETEKEEKLLKKKSDEFAALIEERLLNAYKKIRSNVKNGLAVVPVERGASAGSYLTIPPQRQMEIAQRKKIMTDEHSGRILVDSALAEEERSKIENLLN